MASSHDGTCPRDLLQGLVAGTSPLVCADLYIFHPQFCKQARSQDFEWGGALDRHRRTTRAPAA